MGRSVMFALLCASTLALASGEERAGTMTGANPLRKVVNLLQGLAKKIKAEGEEEEKLHEAYTCHIKKSTTEITKSISDNEAKLPPLQAKVPELTAKLGQLKTDLKKAHEDQAAAKSAVESAQGQRLSDHEVYVAASSDHQSYLDTLAKAIPALEKGNSGSFLQAHGMTWTLQNALDSSMELDEDAKQQVTVFLSGRSEYAPASKNIVGILKTMKDEAEKNLAALKSAEAGQLKNHEALVGAKKREIDSLHEPIQEKTERIAETAIALSNTKQDISETQAALDTDRTFAADLVKTSTDKESIVQKNKAARADEVVAVDETIKILNDDEALEMFKRTLPGASLMQVDTSNDHIRLQAKALGIVSTLRSKANKQAIWGNSDLDLLELALKGGKADFSKVTKMIDGMVHILKEEQSTDEAKVKNCEKQFAGSAEKLKVFKWKLKRLDIAIADKEDDLSTVSKEIQTITESIKQLDDDVKDATSQRKKENTQFQALVSANRPAIDLLNLAKARMDKFYNPPKHPDTGLIVLPGSNHVDSGTLMQISSHTLRASQEILAYQNHHKESNTVVVMLDKLIQDLDHESVVATAGEKRSQTDFESSVQESAARRAEMTQTLVKKESVKADIESDVVDKKQSAKAEGALKLDARKLASQTASDCKWIMANLGDRTISRKTETDALIDTKATLHGATLPSFVQSAKLRGAKAH